MAEYAFAAPSNPAWDPMETTDTSTARPVIIGIYGVPGCGKSFFLEQLSSYRGPNISSQDMTAEFLFYDSSQVLANQVPGGLAAFRTLGDDAKERVRVSAIGRIQDECSAAGKAGVIAGHYSFWDNEDSPEPERVMTIADREVYTHIFYLSPPHDVVSQYRQIDTKRQRRHVSADHLRKWMELEKAELRKACYEAGILFSVVCPGIGNPHVAETVTHMRSFLLPLEQQNEQVTLQQLGDRLRPTGRSGDTPIETVILMDGDRTIGPGDAGEVFWRLAAETVPGAEKDALKKLFSSAPGYSHDTFLQALLLYDDITDDSVYVDLIDQTSAELTLYPEIQAFLHEAMKHKHVVVIVVTCSLAHIWHNVLGRSGLRKVQVIGARSTGNYGVVTPEIKESIVLDLKNHKGLETWVFGDSPIDLPMLCAAEHPVVVVGNEQTRSKTMEAALSEAVKSGLKAQQVLLPETVSPRLDSTRLPVVDLGDPEFTRPIFHQRQHADVVHATDKAASRLLMTPTRDADISGPSLREAHYHVGQYLAVEFVAERIGTEEFDIPHVRGGKTMGFRLKDEAKTLIVALMRAGEPMASGVNSVFPTAMFLHATKPSDLTAPRVNQASTILLVDGVVNEGTTMVKFIRHIRGVAPEARVVVVAGVVQDRCVGRKGGNEFSKLVQEDGNLTVVALRISDNKYTGRGTVDTGNRLFNTTHLP